MRLVYAAVVAAAFASAGCNAESPLQPSSVHITSDRAPAAVAQTSAGTWRVMATADFPIVSEGSLDDQAFDIPGTPQGLRAEVSGRRVTLSWTTPAGADPPTNHVVRLAGTLNGEFATGSAASSVTSPDLAYGNYLVWVKARNGFGDSAYSLAVTFTIGCGAPGRPVLISNVIGSSVYLSWTRTGSPTDQPGVFEVELTGRQTFTTTASTITFDSVPPGRYQVRVRERNVCDDIGEWSNTVEVVVAGGAPPPAPPPGPGPCLPLFEPVLTVTVNNQAVALTWTAASTEIVTYFLEVTGAHAQTIQTSERLFFVDPVPAGTYTARIRARNGCGVETVSAARTFNVAGPPPPAPPPPPPAPGPIVIERWSAAIRYQFIRSNNVFGGFYRTNVTFDVTLNQAVTGSYRILLNAYPFLEQRKTFAGARVLRFDIEKDSNSCPDFHNTIPLFLYDANNRQVAFVNTRYTGTGCAFNDAEVRMEGVATGQGWAGVR